MADLKISALNSLAGADLVAADVVAVVDDSASETKKLTVSDLIANGSTLISDNTIPSAKILFSAGAIDTAELAASAVETAKINDSAVTAAKLADNSSVTLVSTLPASGDFTGQIALDTDDNKIYIWDGSAWDSVKGAGSINVVNGSTTGEINIAASTSGDTVTISATLDDTSAAAQFLGGPTGAGGTVGYRALVGTDLPTASTSAKGGVIVNGNGLAMSGDTITIDNTVTAETSENHIVQYDANGLVTGGRAIVAGDIPIATTSVTGAVKPGSGLEVTATGDLNHSNTVTGATATKVTFDAQGHITATEALVAADIPDLDTSKITTGTFPEARIGSAAVSGAKLKDYAVAQISETTPTADFVSQLFFNPITRDLFMWDGNVFQPIGISAGEIVLAGTYDASTNLLDSVTADGSAAGFTNGASLPAADTGNNRYYVVVSQSGTGSAPAPTVTLEPPDIILSNGTSYVLIETSETITAQIASNVGFTPTGNIAGTNVQAALSEVDSEKVAKAGDTMTGDLTLNNVNIVFEGATENEYETTLTVTDPTADRTITLPNVTGTVVTTGDTGSVTSTMITDGTIVNADISASAEIAVSKLGNGSARQVLQTDSLGTGVEFTDDLDLPGTLDVTGAATLDSTLDVTGATTVTGVINADGKVKFPAGSASAPSFYSGTDTDTGLYFSAADEVSVATSGTQRVVVDSSGIVKLYGNGSTQTKIYGYTGGSQLSYIIGNEGSSDLSINNFTSNNVLIKTNGSERLRIDTSGRLLVGTSSTVGAGNDLVVLKGTAVADASIYLGRNANASSISNGNNLGFIKFGGGDGGEAARISGIADGTWSSTSDCPGRLVFSTTADGASSPTERLRIDSSGNVGIGTTSPSGLLHISGTDTGVKIQESTGSLSAMTANTSQSIGFQGGNAEIGLFKDSGANYSYVIGTYQGSIDIPLVFRTGNRAERMRIDSSGRLLLGTSSLIDSSTASNFQIANASGPRLCIARNNTTVTGGNLMGAIDFYGNDSNGTYEQCARIVAEADGTHGTGDKPTRLALYTTADGASSSTERMRIDSSGRLLVGVSSSFANANADNLQVGDNSASAESGITLGSTTGSGIRFGDASDASAGIIEYFHTDNSLRLHTNATERMRITAEGIGYHISTNHGYHLGTTAGAGTTKFLYRGHHSSTAGTYNSGTECFTVWSNGNVINTNNSYGQISDVKLKENIADANSQWNDIKAVQVRNFNFKEETGNPTHTQIGVIAQEIETVSPGLVTQTPDYDDEGNDLGTVTKGVNYSVLYMKSVKALQEAIERIETLEAKVAALEAE